MKAYTDISQSKILKDILPLESADMYWLNRHIDLTETKYEVFVIEKSNKYIDFFKSYAIAIDNNEIIPCWSLTALLNYLREVDYFPEINADEFEVTMQINYYNENEARPLAPLHNIKIKAESFIDACVELIIKLHELKLL